MKSIKTTLGILIFSALLSPCHPLSAAVVAYYGNNSQAGLAGATGQPSDFGQAVSWKDAQISVAFPNNLYGAMATAGVIQKRDELNLQSHTLFSFNDVFGATGYRIGSSDVINSATLWLYVPNLPSGSVSFSVRGINAADRDWAEAQASFNQKDQAGALSWTGGTFMNSVSLASYSTPAAPVTTGWYSFDITLALRDYQADSIGGIALVSSSTSVSDIRNFYCATDEYGMASQAPGLYVDFTAVPEPARATLFGGLGCLGLAAWRHLQRKKGTYTQTHHHQG